ncbi:glycosyltransferase family 2 protein [Mucilaginibacter sp. Bleaf8]|uniref:glycosyltransferase family A protein n=1 Tax=Mucilaginibacter sp. Bleaf8 TaxID=2834430 RepID=UPI001BCCA665|nr:glycosyltransferase family A protein [Mucilaginibacter sp. Bleaf8]MBS7563852.1 glycosyltransferase family 2 protein [Mucilaginibacter sp. Bleaf8]
MVVPDDIILSVIIPTRNRPHLLTRALRSVALQGFTGFEVCVIDNNPDTDISNAVKIIVDEFSTKYTHLNWIYLHSDKQFAAGARNDGIFATRGRYIAFLDDDDELLENSLHLRVKEMQIDPAIALLYCAGYSMIYPYPFKMYRYYHYDKRRHKDKLMMMSCSSIMINRDLFKKHNLYFDEQQSRMDDYDLCRRVIRLGLKVKSIPNPLVQINLHPETRISSHQLINYDFKDVLIKRWGAPAEKVVYNYAEGVYIWRKCFGIADMRFKDIVKALKQNFNRTPTLSFRIKYLIVSISPKLFLTLYHAGVSLSQLYKNKIANNA